MDSPQQYGGRSPSGLLGPRGRSCTGSRVLFLGSQFRAGLCLDLAEKGFQCLIAMQPDSLTSIELIASHLKFPTQLLTFPIAIGEQNARLPGERPPAMRTLPKRVAPGQVVGVPERRNQMPRETLRQQTGMEQTIVMHEINCRSDWLFRQLRGCVCSACRQTRSSPHHTNSPPPAFGTPEGIATSFPRNERSEDSSLQPGLLP